MNNIFHWQEMAVKAAMDGAWKQAIEYNQKIVRCENEDTAALNRLARAYRENNQPIQAKKTYQKVIKIDPYNLIADKNLKRLSDQGKKPTPCNHQIKTSGGSIFLEEPGKTKLVKLVKLASPEVLCEYDSGNEVNLEPKISKLLFGQNQTYLGSIPDDLSHYLLRLMKAGNQYSAHIKSIDRQCLEIIIRETKRAKPYQDHPSFGISYQKK